MRDWDETGLPERERRLLRGLCEHVRVKTRAAGAPPVGPIVLFEGAPGTGKTLTAKLMARELGRDLRRVDLGRVVAKSIGETEKNLDDLFADAGRSGAVLLFDEADALFGGRTDLADVGGRHANPDPDHLLERLERHRGIVILATNLGGKFDPALLRRIHLVVEFSPRPPRDAAPPA